FGDAKLRHRLLEVAVRGHVDAPGAAPEEDRVEIDLEDLVLGERAVESYGDDHLADLALVADVIADQQVLGDLLRDGRAALGPAGIGEVGDEGADHAALVDAAVLVEALVFRRDK